MEILPALVAIVVALFVSTLLIDPARRIAKKSGYVAVPRPDRFHASTTPLLGGPVCLLGAGIGGWVAAGIGRGARVAGAPAAPIDPALLVGLAGFLLLGLIDDRRSLTPLVKGAAQGLILVAVLLVWGPEGRLASPLYLALACLSSIVLLNGWNYLDHADGVFPTVMAVGAAALALVWAEGSLGGSMSPLLWGSAGAMIGFLLWNLPPARIFLGDAGSLPIAFLLLFASMRIVDSGPIEAVPAAVSVHSIAAIDLLLVTSARLASRTDPFRGGRDHSGHRLSARLGPTRALIAFIVSASILIAIAIGFGARHAGATMVVLALSSFVLVATLLRLPTPNHSPEPTRAGRGKRAGRRRKRSI